MWFESSKIFESYKHFFLKIFFIKKNLLHQKKHVNNTAIDVSLVTQPKFPVKTEKLIKKPYKYLSYFKKQVFINFKYFREFPISRKLTNKYQETTKSEQTKIIKKISRKLFHLSHKLQLN
jgi:hypothetical protein